MCASFVWEYARFSHIAGHHMPGGYPGPIAIGDLYQCRPKWLQCYSEIHRAFIWLEAVYFNMQGIFRDSNSS